MDESLQDPEARVVSITPMAGAIPPMAKRKRSRGKIDPAVIEREYEVLKYRRGGLTFDQIAKKVGYSNESGAREAYKRAMVRTLQEPADELRQLHRDRLETALSAIWAKVLRGELPAIDRMISILNREAGLLGLDAPKESRVEVTNYDGAVLRERAQQIIQIIREHGGTES